MPAVPYLLLDVFTATPFEGNPLAVVVDPPPLDPATMQAIAAELNLSETVFLRPAGAGRWDTRIFTPSKELPFAGHPTVGAAVALTGAGLVDVSDGRGRLTLVEGVGDVDIEIAQAPGTGTEATCAAPVAPQALDRLGGDTLAAVLAALALTAADAHPELPAGGWSAGVPFVVVPLANVDALERIVVDGSALTAALAGAAACEVYAMAPTGRAEHWRARMFAPAFGIAEDPATGSAACAAAGLLATTAPDGGPEGRRVEWLVEQGVEMGRRSLIRLAATVTAGTAERVELGGTAVLVGEGTLRVP